MNQLTNIQQTMSSREIAELTGKTHDNVLKAIRNMEEAWVKVTGVKFNVSEYKDPTGRKLPMYELTKKESLYVATKFNDEARARLILRWEELENSKQFQVPSSLSEALRLAANQAEQIEQQQKQLEEQKPKVLFADAVSASKTTVLIGELAKIIKQNGYDIGQNRLFDYMRKNGYLISRFGSDYNMPTQKSMNLGLFEIKETSITHSDGHISISKTPKVTGKGQQYFIDRFLSAKKTHPNVTVHPEKNGYRKITFRA
ncbi:Rha family phage regulatory protein [Sphingobacterium allocomposti]|uniref:Rha family phage regulatory protein n=1 Tax=Sphingobacterium allocomposti TaxID=415956 RepID=A0A5S5D0A2_9SPHI|nr:phage regulatory protein/antirepressor Ant [Sphingobacterium composti Yoo et al. 2007 non Ten et al. 2007]TYP89467.1 Rha family phage regulatory protein [Sphingobacterium composti Yoo et al. 2007 non Ten et al. 2007]